MSSERSSPIWSTICRFVLISSAPIGSILAPSALNSARNPFFNRVDIRVEKQWWFESWKLALFLDVQNAFNRQNQEALLYNYDYTQTSRVNGLPIIPSLGLRGEF